MTLAVYGRESLDELQAMVTALFGALPNKQRTLDVCQTPPFLPDAFQVRAGVQCVWRRRLKSSVGLGLDQSFPFSTTNSMGFEFSRYFHCSLFSPEKSRP